MGGHYKMGEQKFSENNIKGGQKLNAKWHVGFSIN